LIIAALVFSFYKCEQKLDPADEAIICDAAAEKLGKEPNDLTEDDFAKITELHIWGNELSTIRLVGKLNNLQELRLDECFQRIQFSVSNLYNRPTTRKPLISLFFKK
jgi:hypothetical protein